MGGGCAAALCAIVLLAATSCGGGEDATELTVVPQLDELPPGVPETEALDEVAAILVHRVEILNGEAIAEVTGDGTVLVEVTGIPEDQAADLLGTAARLRIVGPRQDDDELICVAADGTETAVAPSEVTYPVTGATRLPRCSLPDGSLGDIVWDEEVDSASHVNGGLIQSVTLNTAEGPTLAVAFNPAGSAALAILSSGLVGLPMGIFVEDELIGGPTVAEQIADGRIAIAGISLRDARILRAQLLAGEMPVAVVLSDAGG